MSSTRRRRDHDYYFPAASSSSAAAAAGRDHHHAGAGPLTSSVMTKLALGALASVCLFILRHYVHGATGGTHTLAAKASPQYPHQHFVVDWQHSFRDVHLMEKDQACVRAGHGYVHLLHMREAGGTSLQEVLLGENGDGSRSENRPPLKLFHSEGLTFNISCFSEAGTMVHITSLRNPIDRLVSSYWREGRYTADTGNAATGKDEAGHQKAVEEYVETFRAQYLQEPVHFKAHVQALQAKYAQDPELLRTNQVWEGVDNFYVKTLTNRYRPNTTAPVDEEDFTLAKRILDNIDVLLITEWMDSEDETHKKESQGQLGLFNYILGVDVVAFPRAHDKTLTLQRPSREIDEATIAYLEDLNKYDMALYEYAQELIQGRIERLRALQEEAKGGESGGATLRAPVSPDVDTCREMPAEGVRMSDVQLYELSVPVCMLPYRDLVV